ncbi:DUF4238 domain-containing protein [Luteolibacter sp. Populi]|uniref:DUF4238 domain-containing protein n=1 Tax=Luteolibacter sp. Populi TaxID=3230487 RepID=UPI003466881A
MPQAYLAGFADNDGMIAVHDRRQGTYRLQLLKDTGLEGHLYSHILSDGSKQAPIEIMLSKIDGQFPALSKEFHKGAPRFTPTEIEPLFAWISALVFRVPAMQNFLKRLGNRAMDAQLEVALETEEAAQAYASQIFGAESEVAQQSLEGIKTFIEDLEAKYPRANVSLHSSVKAMEQGHRLLCNKAHITVLHAPPGKQFVTSDRGPIAHHPKRPDGVEGYLGPGSTVLVPLSKYITLELIDGPFKILHLHLSREDLTRINAIVTRASLRFVHGDSVQRLRAVIEKAKLGAFSA